MKELLESLKDFTNEWGMAVIVPCIIIGTVVSIYCASRPAQIVKEPVEAEIGITDNTPLNRAAYGDLIDILKQHEAKIQILQAREKEMRIVLAKHEDWLEIVDGSIKDLRKKKR